MPDVGQSGRDEMSLYDRACLARACILIHAAQGYGLVAGGPSVNNGRCEALVAEAEAAGLVLDEADVVTMSRNFIHQFNVGVIGRQQ